MKLYKYIILITFFLLHCDNQEEKYSFSTKLPAGIPVYAKQYKNGQWVLKDSGNGYLAHWLNDGTPILEVFLVNNLTERIIITYPVLSNLKTFYRFKLLRKNYIPENIEDLINLEDEDSQRKRLMKVYFSIFTYGGGIEGEDFFYPREFFNTVMWNSGPNIAFKDKKIFTFTCKTITSYSPDVTAEYCGTKFYYKNSIVEKTSFPLKCNHSCSDKIDIIQKGLYKVNEFRHTNIYQKKNLDSKILKTIERNSIIQVLENRINITDINYENVIWVKVRSGNISGYLLKNSILNRKI